MFVRGIFAAFAALVISAALVGNADAYPTTARSGTSTVTGVYRPLQLNLNVVETVPGSISNCEGPCSSGVYYYPSDSYSPSTVYVDLYMTGTYASNYGNSAVVGNAGYWLYSFSAVDGNNGLSVLGSEISATEFEILISTGGAGTKVGSLTYLGGGSFAGVPPEDTPLTWEDKLALNSASESDDDWFQYYTTLVGAVMRITSSNASGSDFALSFVQPIQHLGPYGSPLNTDRTNVKCFSPGLPLTEENAIPCENVTLSASAIPEPASLALVGLGLAALALGRRRRSLRRD